MIILPHHGHKQALALVLCDVEEDIDGLLAITTFVCCVVKLVHLVNQLYPAHGLFDHLLGLGGRMANPIEIVVGDEKKVATAGVPYLDKEMAHADGDGGLASVGGVEALHDLYFVTA